MSGWSSCCGLALASDGCTAHLAASEADILVNNAGDIPRGRWPSWTIARGAKPSP